MLDEFIEIALKEDIRDGDHTSLSCIAENERGNARLEVREDGVLAGIRVAKRIFEIYDPSLQIDILKKDGEYVSKGDIAFTLKGSARSILSTERLVLNVMQRMSGIATKTRQMVDQISHTQAVLLDTRKTTPGIRFIEKEAVEIGGGGNHRFGLYDMIMIKDNHVDYAGGISNAIRKANSYLSNQKKQLKIEIEVRSTDELSQVIKEGGVDRIMLDNFSPKEIVRALEMVPDNYETEASGGITDETIVEYAETGVNFISVGALTHSVKSLDLSLKAQV
ncbi:carboxylating nicotinate-nucleotide diphosphorylase [Crocinitomicaceae bacterium]|nr:carboxylating nicotinate-nucleotide diphosphorylase [Crocinitomicaceae bacterium]MDC1362102.1 carboxylating nicotinate-nucleotide diphosphorylase [Crocinitomicaceae bacterium]